MFLAAIANCYEQESLVKVILADFVRAGCGNLKMLTPTLVRVKAQQFSELLALTSAFRIH